MSMLIYGAHDAGWLSFYDFLGSKCGTRHLVEQLDGLVALARTAGWCIPCRDVCYVSERHNVLRRDDAGRMHCEDGPAVGYPDGYSLFFWHGTRVPAEWILNRESLTAAKALSWPNLEERRAACEILGWAKILRELNATVINEDHPRIGTLVEVDLPDSGKERFLRVECGTGREFALPVAPDVNTAFEANVSTYPQLAGLKLPVDVLRESMINART
jgi:hypothetical protein